MPRFRPCPRCGTVAFATTVRCRNCGERLDAVPRIGTPRPGRWGLAVLGVGAGVLIVAFALVGASLGSRPTGVVAGPRVSGPPGRVRLAAEATVVPLAVDPAAYERLAQIDAARYGMDYKGLLKEGVVFEVAHRSLADVVEDARDRLLVRVDPGAGRPRLGWVRRDWTEPPEGPPRWEPTLREGGSIDRLERVP